MAFITDYVKLAYSLYELIGLKSLQSGKEHDETFDEIKEAMTTPSVLALLNGIDQFILDSDASDDATGCELLHVLECAE